MKIQLDEKGQSRTVISERSEPSGVLIGREKQTCFVDVGSNPSPQALFAAMTYVRSMPYRVTLTKAHDGKNMPLPFDSALTASESCFAIGHYLLRLLEKNQTYFKTTDIRPVNRTHVAEVPLIIHHLTDLFNYTLPTSTALSRYSEDDLAPFSFIRPSVKQSFDEADYTIMKLPRHQDWPAEDGFVPLSVGELCAPPYDTWINSLCHIALCTKRPIIQFAEMRLALKQKETDDDKPAIYPEPEWHEIIRIIYPFAAPSEKPSNYRLLMGAVIPKTNQIIL